MPFPVFAQQVQVLPEFLERELDTVAAGTAFQLEANKTVEAVSSEANYKDKIVSRVEKDLKGFNGGVKSSMGLAAIAAGIGFYGLMSNVSGGESAHLAANTQSMTKLGIEEEHILSGLSGSFIGGTLVTASLDELLHKNQVKVVLNETKVDGYSASIAKMFAKIFQLDSAKESAVKFAIREEIYQKVKNNDDKPLDIYKILGSTKYAGKNVVSPADLGTLAELKKKDEAGHGFVPQEKNKVTFLLAGNAFLKEQLNLGQLKEDDAAKARHQVAQNDAMIAKLQEFRISTGEVRPSTAEEFKEGAAE